MLLLDWQRQAKESAERVEREKNTLMKKNQDEIKKKLQQDLTKLQNEAEIKELQSKIDQLKME